MSPASPAPYSDRVLRRPDPTFLDSQWTDPKNVATPYVVLGVPFGPPYEPEDLVHCADAPAAVRRFARAGEYGALAGHYDFDLGGPAPGGAVVSDLGDIAADLRRPEDVSASVVSVLAPLTERGVVPLVLGGNDSIPLMVARSLRPTERFDVLHVDAHLDFRDEVDGEREGYSSGIRRIRELGHIDRIVQVGLRSVGSARPQDVADALAAGNELFPAATLESGGLEPVLAALTGARRWFVSIDCDGLDPSIAPGVGYPEPGGLSYRQMRQLLRALDGRIAAVAITEYRPAVDVRELTALTITRLLVNLIGAVAAKSPNERERQASRRASGRAPSR